MFKCPHKPVIPSYGHTTASFHYQCYYTSRREACCDKTYRIFATKTENLVYSQACINGLCGTLPRCPIGFYRSSSMLIFGLEYRGLPSQTGAGDGALLDCGNDTEV
ncbi:unnamed protein product [Fusarium fujikuroi]|nr:unnamed protein product [Fusarium fujikuroi]VZH99426.1 unnamed protein product [Fusarium fujikuroi]